MSVSALFSNRPKVITRDNEDYFVCEWTGQFIKTRFGIRSKKKELKGCFASPGCVVAALKQFYSDKKITPKDYNHFIKKLTGDSDVNPEILPLQAAPHHTELQSFGGRLSWEEYKHKYDHDKQIVALSKSAQSISDYLKKVSDKKGGKKRTRNWKSVLPGSHSDEPPAKHTKTAIPTDTPTVPTPQRRQTRSSTPADTTRGVQFNTTVQTHHYGGESDSGSDSDSSDDSDSQSEQQYSPPVDMHDEPTSPPLTQATFIPHGTPLPKTDAGREVRVYQAEERLPPVVVTTSSYMYIIPVDVHEDRDKALALYNSKEPFTSLSLKQLPDILGKHCIVFCTPEAMLFEPVISSGASSPEKENRIATALLAKQFERQDYVLTRNAVLISGKPLATLLPPEDLPPSIFASSSSADDNSTMPSLKVNNITAKISTQQSNNNNATSTGAARHSREQGKEEKKTTKARGVKQAG
jgi:hypothetical protein